MASKKNVTAPGPNKDTYDIQEKGFGGMTVTYDQGDPAYRPNKFYKNPEGGVNTGYGTSAPKNSNKNGSAGDAPFFKHTIKGKC